MRKYGFGSFAAIGLTLSLLAGCSGGSADAPAAQTPTPTNNGAEEPAAAEKVTIKFHTHGTEAQYNWEATIAAFEEAYPNIRVELVPLSEKGDTNEATQKLDLAAASGEQLDVLMFSDPASYAQRVGLGMVAPIDSFIGEDGFKVAEEYKVDTQMNGQYYALPGKFNPWYVMLNKDHLDAAGLEVPTDWTWDDFMAYAKALTTGEGASKRYGTYFHGPQNGGWMEFLRLALANRSENTDFLKADGTSNLDDPMFRRTLELRLQMEREDGSSTPYADMLSQKLHYRTQFFNQSASMVLIGSWMNSELGGTEQNPLNFNVAIAPYPKNGESDQIGYTPVTTDFMAVAAKSKHQKEAYQFIRWYTTEGLAKYGRNIPSWNKVSENDLETIVDSILSGTQKPENVDKASLINVLKNSKSGKIIPPVTYQAEVYKALNEQYELLILGSQDLDTTLANMQAAVQEIIDNNK
ncbi:sugar ABC transporter substrate-binding protein [Paenibacillus sp.]|uniref:ABC transporter substrate-binding protein n=1 Tax=Paenibacillus sp. TaxID=58172 RepID=UPI002D3DD3E7|nr:sugar ABC transporter substrate-binding protein [Paenibacillus sp.]HZG86029.1 sugar ABC transporter substrate-binding protein [Paenibacillus sp.]